MPFLPHDRSLSDVQEAAQILGGELSDQEQVSCDPTKFPPSNSVVQHWGGLQMEVFDNVQMEHLWPHSQVQVSQSYKAATRLPVCGKVFGHRIPGGLGQKSFFSQL